MLVLSVLAGCHPEAAPTPTYYEDIKPIVDAHCVGCHAEGGVGPFPLSAPDQVAAAATLVRWSVESGSMPPWGAAGLPDHPLRYDVSLSEAQIDTIARWEAGGAPLGSPEAEGEPIVLEQSLLDRTDLTLRMPEPYTPDDAQLDDYRCFPIDWPEASDAWVTGFLGQPGFEPVVHHMLAFIVSPGDVDAIDRYDEASEGPGYPCFGFVSSTEVEEEEIVNARVLGQWAPGTGAVRVGQDTGIFIEPGSQIVLQMHYSTAVDTLMGDQSGLDIELTRSPPDAEAFTVVWTDFGWFLGTTPMGIPAGAPSTTHTYQAPLVGSLNLSVAGATDELEGGAQVRSILPHMHKVGRRIDLSVLRSDGTEDLILSVPDWDFDWQRQYEFIEPVHVAPGEELRLECTWDNSEAYRASVGLSGPSIGIGWGEGTYDEMCAAILNVSAPAG